MATTLGWPRTLLLQCTCSTALLMWPQRHLLLSSGTTTHNTAMWPGVWAWVVRAHPRHPRTPNRSAHHRNTHTQHATAVVLKKKKKKTQQRQQQQQQEEKEEEKEEEED